MPNTHDPRIKALLSRHDAKSRMNGMMDAITNLNTGIGTARDKTRGSFYADAAPLDPGLLDSLFANNDLAYTIVTKPVDDALRAWFDVERKEQTEDEEEVAHDICLALEKLGARERMKEGATWGRLFGGGGVIMVVRGGGLPSTKLDDAKITELVELITFSRCDMTPYTWYKNGNVETYLWMPQPLGGGSAQMPQVIHETRLLMFGGARTTRLRRRMNQGWELSILQRVYEVLSSFDNMWGSLDNMFADASQAVFKMQGLIESLDVDDGGQGKQDVQTRLAFMDMVRSTAKAIMLDAGNKARGDDPESFEVVERTTLGTLDGVIQTYMIRLATAARMPLTVLLGMAPAGMDATGESDLLLHYNNIDIYRQDDLEPNFLRLVKIIARTLGDEDVDSWKIKWPELARPKPIDVATAEKMNTDAVVELIVNQAILPEEAALNLRRFAPNLGLRIDLASRRKALKDGLDEVENREVGKGQLEAEGEVATKQAVAVAKAKPKPNTPAKAGARATKANAAKRQT